MSEQVAANLPRLWGRRLNNPPMTEFILHGLPVGALPGGREKKRAIVTILNMHMSGVLAWSWLLGQNRSILTPQLLFGVALHTGIYVLLCTYTYAASVSACRSAACQEVLPRGWPYWARTFVNDATPSALKFRSVSMPSRLTYVQPLATPHDATSRLP